MTDTPKTTTDPARRVLLEAGADRLEPRPWQHRAEPPDAGTLARFALWRTTSTAGAGPTPELAAGLALIDEARSDLDTLEAALLLSARAEGMTWGQVAEKLGLRTPQAAQQRWQRVSRSGDQPAEPGAPS